MLKSYKELIVWQKSIQLVKEIFILSEKFPQSELYGLSSQMRRAAVAIPSNIAEGYGRNSPKEYIQFLYIANGSALELETQVIIAKELNFIKGKEEEKVKELLEQILKMLNKLISSIKEFNGGKKTRYTRKTLRSG